MAMHQSDRELLLAWFRKIGIDIDEIMRLEPTDKTLLLMADDLFKRHIASSKHPSVTIALPNDPDFVPLAFFLRLAELGH